MIRIKKLNVIREIDESELNLWTKKGYKPFSKSEYSNILPERLLDEENIEENEEPQKENKKSSK